MPFKCASCGITFDTGEDFIKHKRSHQEGGKKRLVCLRCGRPIAIDASKANYRGDVLCPGCGQKIRVVIQDGEVTFAATKSD
ncbi:MAG: hypothetical protein A2Y91_08240 [Chloroflexi bacterium RBG_13_54_8]|nr:MAG: hypothetical protein A2Y91_08240 [Chloroflexi bacterium RBG_13_54_8]